MGYTGRRPSNAPLGSGDIQNGIIAKEDLDTALQSEVDGKADIATAVNGSDSTHTGDYYSQSTGWRVVLVGGNATNGLAAGPLGLRAVYGSASAGVLIGAAVSF